jgi:hypothetical protein
MFTHIIIMYQIEDSLNLYKKKQMKKFLDVKTNNYSNLSAQVSSHKSVSELLKTLKDRNTVSKFLLCESQIETTYKLEIVTNDKMFSKIVNLFQNDSKQNTKNN